MSSEIELYRGNVPHGDGGFEYADWSSSQNTVSVTAGTGKEIYVNSVRFIASTSLSMSAGSFTLAGGNFSHQIDAPFELYALSDPFVLKNEVLEGSNQYVIGEIKFNPPVVVSAGSSFTITPSGLTMSGALHWGIEYWEDSPATA